MQNEDASFRFTTIIQGTIAAAQADSLELDTAVGPFKFRLLPGLRVRKLHSAEEIGRFEGVNRVGHLVGDACVCRVSLRLTNDGIRGDALFELTSFGSDTTTPTSDPAFWGDLASFVANFWLGQLDEELGGVFTQVLREENVPPGSLADDKWSAMVSRFVAGMSLAFQLTGHMRYLEAAYHAYDFLKEKCTEENRGLRFFKSRVLRDGRIHPDASPLYNIFEQAYSVTGPLRLLAATNYEDCRGFCKDCLESLSRFHDPIYKGFYDAIHTDSLEPIYDETSTKSFTSGIDLLAAAGIFAHDLKICAPGFSPGAVCAEIAHLTMAHHVVAKSPFIIESLNRDWTTNTSAWRNKYATPDFAGNIGASAKVARMLIACIPLLEADQQARAWSMASDLMNSLLAVGAWDPVRGGVYDVMLRSHQTGGLGHHVCHSGFVWWTAEQFLVSCYLLHFHDGDRRWKQIAQSIERHWLACFVTPRGCASDTVDGEGYPVDSYVGHYVKSCLHEIEICYYMALLKAAESKSPLTLYFSPDFKGDYISAITEMGILDWQLVERRTRSDGVAAAKYLALAKDR